MHDRFSKGSKNSRNNSPRLRSNTFENSHNNRRNFDQVRPEKSSSFRMQRSNFGRDSRESGFKHGMNSSYRNNGKFNRARRHQNYHLKNGNDTREESRRSSYYQNDNEKKNLVYLFNPTTVPRSGKYFEHDSRNKDVNYFRSFDNRQRMQSRNRRLYDPRADFSYNNKHKRTAPMGWRNQTIDFKRLCGNNTNYSDEDYKSGPVRSADKDEVWVHDKFELDEQEANVDTSEK